MIYRRRQMSLKKSIGLDFEKKVKKEKIHYELL